MRLFLSSKNLGHHPDELVDLVGENKRVAYIGNAKDGLSDSERSDKIQEHKEQFEAHGFEFVEIDLRDSFDEMAVRGVSILEGYGLVWCSGGNTFLLRKALELSGVDEVLVNKIKNGEIVYGGSSAGAVVAGPTLYGVENGDNPKEVERVYGQGVNWTGLNIVSFVAVPHWKSDWFDEQAHAMARQLSEQGVGYKVLIDGQVYLLDGDRGEVLA